MPKSNERTLLGRRKVLAAAGAASFGLSGCLGGGDSGDGGESSGGSSSGGESSGGSSSGGESSGGSSSGGESESSGGSEETEMASWRANISQVGYDFTTMPYVAAIRDLMPENTDGRMEGAFTNVSSGSLALQTFISGETQFYTSSPGPVYQAYTRGQPIRCIAPKIRGTDYVLAVRSDIESLKEFENSDLSFGISSPGALSQLQPLGIFQEEGIDTDAINWVQIGGSSDRTSALAAGNVDGTGIHIAQFEQLISEGVDVRNAASVKDYFPNFMQEAIFTTQEHIDEHPEYMQAQVDAMVEAHTEANNSFDWLFGQAQQWMAQPPSQEEAQSSYDLNIELDAWPTEEYGQSGFEGVLQMMDGGGLLNADDVNLDEMLVTEFWDNAVENAQ